MQPLKVIQMIKMTDFSMSSLPPDDEAGDRPGERRASPFITTLRLALT